MFEGDRRPIVPTFYINDPDDRRIISVKVPANGVPEALAAIDRTWHRFAPTVAINRHFLDDRFREAIPGRRATGRDFRRLRRHRHLHRLPGPVRAGRLLAGRRTKEIGIRKSVRRAHPRRRAAAALAVLDSGADRQSDRLAGGLVLPADWLEGFAYRITLNPLYFLGAGVVALVIAWATVFAHALRVARANPIHALRYE